MNLSKARRFSLAITVLVVIIVMTIGVVSFFGKARAAAVCSPATAISVPYTKDGVGDVCLVATWLGTYINSWNLTTLEVNGTSYLNTYVAASSIAPLNGTYTIHYVSTVAYGHFEIAGMCCTTPTNTPITPVTPTRTPTTGIVLTPTRTPTAGPTATRTRTPTIGGPTPTLTRTPTGTATCACLPNTPTRTPTMIVDSRLSNPFGDLCKKQ